jgi:hypothetical protein
MRKTPPSTRRKTVVGFYSQPIFIFCWTRDPSPYPRGEKRSVAPTKCYEPFRVHLEIAVAKVVRTIRNGVTQKHSRHARHPRRVSSPKRQACMHNGI